jgi:hypothetical protein
MENHNAVVNSFFNELVEQLILLIVRSQGELILVVEHPTTSIVEVLNHVLGEVRLAYDGSKNRK